MSRPASDTGDTGDKEKKSHPNFFGGTTSFFYPSFFFHPSFYFQVILPSFFKEKPSFFLSILPSFIMYTSFFFLFLCIQPSFFPIPFFFYVFNLLFLCIPFFSFQNAVFSTILLSLLFPRTHTVLCTPSL